MDGLVTVPSDFPVWETIDRLAAFVQANGLTVFLRIDHAVNAREIGLSLRPTELIVFGNPKAGTVLMQDKQTVGIDIPMRTLAWEDENGKVWLTYNDGDWIVERHDLSEKSNAIINAIKSGMIAVCEAATKA